jgi:phosphatidylserine synthase
MKKTLLPLSMFTFACAYWLGVMEMTLRHPEYGLRVGVAALIALISMATILVRTADLGVRGERWLWVGAVVLIGIGGQAFVRNARATHFEGFVLVISVALVVQGLLTLVSVMGTRRQARSS